MRGKRAREGEREGEIEGEKERVREREGEREGERDGERGRERGGGGEKERGDIYLSQKLFAPAETSCTIRLWLCSFR